MIRVMLLLWTSLLFVGPFLFSRVPGLFARLDIIMDCGFSPHFFFARHISKTTSRT